MTLHHAIRRNRRHVSIGIMVALALAIGFGITRLTNSDTPGLGETLGAVALAGAYALPAGIAWLSLDRRPALLPAAAIAELLLGVAGLVVLPLVFIPALLWFRAWQTRPIPTTTTPPLRIARIGLALVPVLALVALLAHTDPRCNQTLADGTNRTVDAAERGLEAGWTVGLGTRSTQSSASISGDVVSEECVSDTVLPWEAAVSGLVSAGGLFVAARWPIGTRPTPARHET